MPAVAVTTMATATVGPSTVHWFMALYSCDVVLVVAMNAVPQG